MEKCIYKETDWCGDYSNRVWGPRETEEMKIINDYSL